MRPPAKPDGLYGIFLKMQGNSVRAARHYQLDCFVTLAMTVILVRVSPADCVLAASCASLGFIASKRSDAWQSSINKSAPVAHFLLSMLYYLFSNKNAPMGRFYYFAAWNSSSGFTAFSFCFTCVSMASNALRSKIIPRNIAKAFWFLL